MKGKYRLIYADPPWSYSNQSSRAPSSAHYQTMSLTDLKRLPVWDLAADDAVLAMWWVPALAPEAIQLVEAWGFKLKTMTLFTWLKLNPHFAAHIDKHAKKIHKDDFPFDHECFMYRLEKETCMGMGNYTRGNTESVLLAVKGKGLPRFDAGVKQVIYAPRSQHSRKPAEARERLDKLFCVPPRWKIELFARGPANTWDTWGLEAETNIIALVPGFATDFTQQTDLYPANDNQPDLPNKEAL